MDYLSYIESLLATLTGDPKTGETAFLVMVGASVFVLMVALMLVVTAFANPLRGRLRALEEPASSRGGRASERAADALGPLAAYVLPKEEARRGVTRRRLLHAGYRNANALTVYYAVRLLLALILPGLVVAAAALWPRLPTGQVLMFAGVAGAFGLLLPSMYLDRAVRRRQARLRRGVPDALDLLVVCTEAGLGLKAAIQRVADDIGVSHPELADELNIVNLQTRAGVDNVVALRDLADRTGLEDIRGLTSALAQSLRFGTNLAETLRIHSEDMRDKRTQRAEEKAATISTKMIFPLALCLFPSLFLVLVGPAVLGALKVLGAR